MLDWIKNLWNGAVAIFMFLYLVCVFAIGKLVGLKHLHKGYWKWLRKVICRNGPIWVKICQWMSNRPDICNPKISDELASLREHCPTHNWDTTAKIFKEDTRRDITQYLQSVEKKPFASGSIGQVYRGVLLQKKDISGTDGGVIEHEIPVVIKVQHPGLEVKMKWFFVFVKWWNNFFGLLGITRYQIPISVKDMETHLTSQLDYQKEGYNMTIAAKNFEGNPHIVIPSVYYSSRRVLITRYEPGIHYIEYKKKYPDNFRELTFADNIIKISVMQMILIDDMTHADLHDGNWSMRRADSETEKLDNYKNGYPQIVIYDWGLVTTTGDTGMNRTFFHQLRIGDFGEILNIVEKYISRVTKWKSEKFASFKNLAMTKFTEEKAKKTMLRLRDKLDIILNVIRTYQFVLQPSLISLITTLQLLQEQMVARRQVNKGDEEMDYLASISIQLAFCRGSRLFPNYSKYLEEVNDKMTSGDKSSNLFVEGELYLKKYTIGEDDISDVESWDSMSSCEDSDDSDDDGEEDSDEEENGDNGEDGDEERNGDDGEGNGGEDNDKVDEEDVGDKYGNEEIDNKENKELISNATHEGENLVIENSVYSNNPLSDDMMKEIRQELLHHFPPLSKSEEVGNNK